MSIKKRLNNLKFLDDTIKSKRQEIFALESLVQKAQVYSDEPKGSRQGNKTEELNVKIIDEKEKIENEIMTLWSESRKTIAAIDQLEDPLERAVLRYTYVNGYNWIKTTGQLNCSRTTYQRAKKSGIEHLALKI